MDQYRRGELVFDVIDAGPADGPVVILLHGFPQMNTSWNAVITKLTARGYRCLAPNQRGYSRGARPTRRRDYRVSELVEDVRTLIDASGAHRVHLVGHDCGAFVVWFAAAQMPDRLATASPLSTPHPVGGRKALLTSWQIFASWYVLFFQLPRIPERVFIGSRGTATGLSKFLQAHRQTPENAERDARAMAAPGRFTAAVNWYRAMPLANFVRLLRGQITVPTMHVFSDGDTFLSPKGAHASGRNVSSEYRFELLRGVSHWMLDEDPDAVADLLLEWFVAQPV
ncbi:alpha/beta fold hydrolase [Mycolicibacterium stellerae]|uniref:alpha/beta fold hydrolase n=1 Tax=Mycolicibacterium stellerae TaxID=2358193 RepID=UPI000F0BB4FD|nr:alpha/beta fold hydrolase [Mycolicibacterium stellerae]